MQLSLLSDCDDVALPALKLDPDTEMAHGVLVDVEVRQRAVLHDVECSCDDASRVSRYLEWIAISVPPPALFYAGMIAGMRRPSRVQHTPPPTRRDG
jgi:hypothetical protein